MKKILILGLMLFTIISYSQKKINGTIYIDHPAINTVESMLAAFVEGDTTKVASFLSDDFKAFNVSSTKKDSKETTKRRFLNLSNWWKNNIDYLSIKRSSGAYPYAKEYIDSNLKDVVWVQTWTQVNGVHNGAGIKLDMPYNSLFIVNKDNKISTVMDYFDDSIFRELDQSYTDRHN